MGPPPLLHRFHRTAAPPRLDDVASATIATLMTVAPAPPGCRVAVCVGSRGLADLVTVVAEVVRWLRASGAEPFLVPAMGSHGGATAEGQRAVLEGYGLLPDVIGAEIVATMDVVELAAGAPIPAFVDAAAATADAVVLVNRVKPHTDFGGMYESGLVKMAAIGLGNAAQATAIHVRGALGLQELIAPVGGHVIDQLPVTCGIAVVENRCGETLHVEAIPGPLIMAREPELLALARANSPALPVTSVDLLLVERIGKEVSGTGMDTHVIGRRRVPGQPEPTSPLVAAIYAASLTEASHGNALGMGLADVVSRSLAAAVDRTVTNENVLTSGFLARGNLPFVAADDTQAVTALCRAAGVAAVGDASVLVIRDTLDLETVLASWHLSDELVAAGYCEEGNPVPLLADGVLPSL